MSFLYTWRKSVPAPSRRSHGRGTVVPGGAGPSEPAPAPNFAEPSPSCPRDPDTELGARRGEGRDEAPASPCGSHQGVSRALAQDPPCRPATEELGQARRRRRPHRDLLGTRAGARPAAALRWGDSSIGILALSTRLPGAGTGRGKSRGRSGGKSKGLRVGGRRRRSRNRG